MMTALPRAILDWANEIALLTKPKEIYYCSGSDKEYESLCDLMVESKTAIPLNPTLRPRSYLVRSDPRDVARTEESTYICSEKRENAGPTNNWEDPVLMKLRLRNLLDGSMRGRTLYVIPFCMGPLKSPFSRLGVQITDSPYVAASLRLMTRMGDETLHEFEGKSFVKALHTVGAPLKENETDVPWPCNIKDRVIAHFPETDEIISFGSGYGGNALLGKKCFALRLASCMGEKEGWLAEHMLIMGLTNPKGEKIYVAAAFPSSCGKTNLAMMTPTLPGWKVELVGDDIAWMHFNKEGELRAINPELGLFGVLPGTSEKTNPAAIKTMKEDTLFTNAALTDQNDVWWEGLSQAPKHLIDWQGADWSPDLGRKAAQPNSRFCTSIERSPILDPLWNSPEGVPISAILFGGRRSTLLPLIMESYSWNHGVLMGAMMSSETTSASSGAVGNLRHDPFAMLPFCGYHMGDYFAHWIEMGKSSQCQKKLPSIFMVNWFLKDKEGAFLWPGFGDNIRVLAWVFERVKGLGKYKETPVGIMPQKGSLPLEGLSLLDESALFDVDRSAWKKEIDAIERYFDRFSPKMPKAVLDELQELKRRVLSGPETL